MMNLASVRSRLAAWYLAVLVSAMILLAVGTWAALRHQMYRSLNDSLSAGAAGLSQFLERESDGDDLPSILQEAREYTSALPAGNRLRLWNADGSLLLAFPQAEPAHLMFAETRDIVVRGHRLRLELSAPVQPIEQTLSTLRNVLLACMPIVLAAAALGGWWLSRTALQPVDRMTETAESISANDLSARLPVPRTGDELQRLGEAWNGMLDRLSDSVEKMRRFTADAAHELRTPIAVIRSTAELALRRDRDAAAYRKALATIGDEARNVSDLVADLLWLARSDSSAVTYHFEDCEPFALVQEVCHSAEPLAAAREVKLITEVKIDPPYWIRSDRNALRRVLLILIDNAIKFSPPNAAVHVRVDALSDCCVIAVEDRGSGISAKDLPHIFDRFYTSDRSRNTAGFGLGLAIAKAIVEAHAGRIEVESAVDAGSRFRILLPASPVAARSSVAL